AMSARTWRTFWCGCCRRATSTSPTVSAASFTSTRSTRSRGSPRIPASRATYRAKACSRRCSRFWKALWLPCRRRGAASLRRKHPQQEYIQINTKDILFICGGAFDGLEKIIEARVGRRAIGFAPKAAPSPGAPVVDKNPFTQVEPDDLLRYGLIPELVGRLPV